MRWKEKQHTRFRVTVRKQKRIAVITAEHILLSNTRVVPEVPPSKYLIKELKKQMLASHHYCEICQANLLEIHKKFIHLDHDHKTMQIRGLLCNSCNIGLGLFKEDKVRILEAFHYLNRYAEMFEKGDEGLQLENKMIFDARKYRPIYDYNI